MSKTENFNVASCTSRCLTKALTRPKRRGRERRTKLALHTYNLHNYTGLTYPVHIKLTNNNLNLDFRRVTKT